MFVTALWLNCWDQMNSDTSLAFITGSFQTAFFLVHGSEFKMVCCFHDALKTNFYINWAFRHIQYYYIIYSHNFASDFWGNTLLYTKNKKNIVGWTLENSLVSAIWEVDILAYIWLHVAKQESRQRTNGEQGDGHQMNKWTDASLERWMKL